MAYSQTEGIIVLNKVFFKVSVILKPFIAAFV